MVTKFLLWTYSSAQILSKSNLTFLFFVGKIVNGLSQNLVPWKWGQPRTSEVSRSPGSNWWKVFAASPGSNWRTLFASVWNARNFMHFSDALPVTDLHKSFQQMAKIIAGSMRESAKNVTIGALADPIRGSKPERTPTKREGMWVWIKSISYFEAIIYLFVIIAIKAQRASNFVCNNS